MHPAFLLAFLFIQLIASSAVRTIGGGSIHLFNGMMSINATSATVGERFEYKVGDTRVRLEIYTSPSRHELPDRDTLMCVIEAMGKLENNHPGDPIEDNKVKFDHNLVQIVLEDQGSPKGRFLNDIAGWTLRGIADWMSKNDYFREMSVRVYYNQYFCGVAEVKLVRRAEA